MALNIPMPEAPGTAFAGGINTGSTLFSRLMQTILEREKQKQLQNQFEKSYLLDQSKDARANALQPYLMSESSLRNKLLQQQITSAIHKNDPMWELNQIKSMERAFGGGSSPASSAIQKQTNASESPNPSFSYQGILPGGSEYPESHVAENIPNSEAASAESPIAPPVSAAPQPSGGLNTEMLKQHPLLLGWLKHKYGIDPLAVDKGSALHGPARDASDLDKLKKEAGENSEVYQNAKAAYDASLDAKKDLRDLRARTKQGLKPGEKEFFDEKTGAPLGKEIPLTEKERDSEQGNVLFNELYPYVYKGASPFSGEGSISRLQQAAAHYKTDPKAREMFDNFLLADKMLAATTVNEAATLKAGKQNTQFRILKESLEAQDIPSVIKKLTKEYNIPASAQLTAAMRYQKALSDARQKAKRSTPATQKLFYNPDMQAQHEAAKEQSAPAASSDSGSTILMTKDGKKYNIPSDKEADALKEGFKRD